MAYARDACHAIDAEGARKIVHEASDLMVSRFCQIALTFGRKYRSINYMCSNGFAQVSHATQLKLINSIPYNYAVNHEIKMQ